MKSKKIELTIDLGDLTNFTANSNRITCLAKCPNCSFKRSSLWPGSNLKVVWSKYMCLCSHVNFKIMFSRFWSTNFSNSYNRFRFTNFKLASSSYPDSFNMSFRHEQPGKLLKMLSIVWNWTQQIFKEKWGYGFFHMYLLIKTWMSNIRQSCHLFYSMVSFFPYSILEYSPYSLVCIQIHTRSLKTLREF